ncbi:MAG: DUF3566 domain-containing protein [Nitriliruptoraceae bacterium]
MARRRFTVKRIDPWSVLKFGALANVALLAIFLLAMTVVWFIVDRLMIVDQICGIAADIGFSECGLSGGNMFRAALFLGLLWTVVQTAIVVFLAFLHNLIADLTGGVVIAVLDEAIEAPPSSDTRRATSPEHARPDATAAMPSSATGRVAAPRRSGGDQPRTPTSPATSTSRSAQAPPTPRRSTRAPQDTPRTGETPPSPRPRRDSGDDQLFGGG